MKKYLFYVLLLICAVVALPSFASAMYPLQTQTGVVPIAGNYIFSSQGVFSVSAGTGNIRAITFSADGYAYYTMSVNNGEFHYQNGIVAGNKVNNNSGKQYPTDGFRIAGHFTAPNLANGVINYVYNGKITSTANFTANLNVGSITISPTSTTLISGQTLQFTSIVRDNYNNQISATPNWVSSNTAVATVSLTGLVTAVSAGTANITAVIGSVISNVSVVTVNPSAPVISTFTANPSSVVVDGTTILSWTLAGDAPTSLTIDNGVGSVLGTTSKAVSVASATTYTITATNAIGTDTKQVVVTTFPKILLAHYAMENNSNDSTVNANNGTATATTYSTGKINQGAVFNGTSSYIKLPQSDTLNIVGDISVSAWVYRTSNTYDSVVHKGSQYGILIDSTGKIAWADSSNWDFTAFGYYGNVPLNSWQHITVTKTGSTVTMYLNGNAIVTKTFGGPIITNTSAPFIGCYGGNSGSTACTAHYFAGNIDEVKLWNYGLTAQEVQTEYNRAFTPTAPTIATFTASPSTVMIGNSVTLNWTLEGSAPTSLIIDNGVGSVLGTTSKVVSPTTTTTYTLTATNSIGTTTKQTVVTVTPAPPKILLAHYAMENNSNDSTVNANNGTATATTYSTGKINQGAVFNGTSSYIKLPQSDTLNIVGDISVSAWVYRTSNTYDSVVHKGSQYGILIDSTGKIAWADSSNWDFTAFGYYGNVPLNSWQHITVTKTGSTVTMYLNGNAIVTKTFGGPIITNTSAPFIGCYGGNSGSTACTAHYFAGNIDEVKLWNYGLTAQEVQTEYNRTAIVLSTITISPTTASLTAGGSAQQLTPTTLDQYGNPITATLTWASSNTAVATVSSTGLVTPVSAGVANITASAGGITSLPCVVTVNNLVPKSITITPLTANLITNLTITGHASQQLTATVLDQNDNPVSVNLTWTSSNPSVATVDSNGLVKSANLTGTTEISASYGGVTSTVPAVITGKYVYISVTPGSMFLAYPGTTLQMSATILDQNNNPFPISNWSSDSPTFATVDSNGLVTAVKKGSARITASIDTFSSSTIIFVGANPPSYAIQSETGVSPTVGNYSFSSRGSFRVFSGVGNDKILIFSADGYTWYKMSINNGEFHYQNGFITGSQDNSNNNFFPTDGFRIAGHFDTPTSASGTIDYVFNGDITSTANFTATIVDNTQAPTISTFTATPDSITSGDSTTLAWTLGGDAPTSLSIDNGVGSVLGTTSKVVSPTTTTTYTITATNSAGTATKQVTVAVADAYSYTTANVSGSVERKFYFGQHHFLTVILDPNNAIAIRPHPGLDINGWGSSLYLEPFLAGATLRGTTVQAVNVQSTGINFIASGVVARGTSSSYGTWDANLTFSYNSAQKDITGAGTYNVNLAGTLSDSTGDLNLYKLASNYLVNVPLLDGTTGNTGDIKNAVVSGGGLSDFTWIPTYTTYPQDYRNPLTVATAGDYNQVDTEAQGYALIAPAYKPNMTVALSSAQTGLPMIVGMAYNNGQSQQFWSDNVGITPLILRSSTYTNYNFDVAFNSSAIAGDH